MKKQISFLLALVLILSAGCTLAAADPRLDFREGDDILPYADGQYFTRYTPWLKMLHLTSEAEIAAGSHGGEACQQIRCIDISPVDSDLAVFGTDSSGVWITTNGGDFWYNTNRNIIPADVADVMCHPANKNIILAYMVGSLSGSASPGIYRSTDMGRTWTNVYTDYISSSMTDKLFAYDDKYIYAVTAKGIIRSADSGETWVYLKKADEADSNSTSNKAAASSIRVSADGSTIAACYADADYSLGGINVSTDGGTTWTKAAVDGSTDIAAYAFEFDTKGNRWIASCYLPQSSRYGLFISSDNGDEWTEFKSKSDGSYDVVRSHDSLRRIRIDDNYLYVSYSAADKSFRRLPYSYLGDPAYASAWEAIDFAKLDAGEDTFRGRPNMFMSQGFDIEGDTMYVCAAGPQKYTFSTDTWERKSSGFSGVMINHFNMDSEGNMMLSATDGNVIYSTGVYDGENVPSFVQPGSFNKTVATLTLRDKYDPEGDRFICWYGKSNYTDKTVGIIVTEDKGHTYNQYAAPEGSTEKVFTPVITDPCNKDTVLLEYSEIEPRTIYTSCATGTDNGDTWTANDYYYLDVSGEKIIAWDIYGTSPTYDLMYSPDMGISWQSILNIGQLSDMDYCAFFDSEDTNKLWYRATSDFGTVDIANKKKTSYKSKTDYDMFSKLVQNPSMPNHLLLSCKCLISGYCPTLYESYDYGASWHVVPGFFGRRTVDGDIAFSATTDEVFIGTHNGIYVYEYNNFNYYQGMRLVYDDAQALYTAETNADGTVTLPRFDDFFSLSEDRIFDGWRINGKLYDEGERIKPE